MVRQLHNSERERKCRLVSFLGEHSYDDVRLITHNAEPDPDPDPDPDAADPSIRVFIPSFQ